MTFLRRPLFSPGGAVTSKLKKFFVPLSSYNWVPTETVPGGTKLILRPVGGGTANNGGGLIPCTPDGTSPPTEISNDYTSYGGIKALGYSTFQSQHTESFYGRNRVTAGCLVGMWLPEGSPDPGYQNVAAICIATPATSVTAPPGGGNYTLWLGFNWPGNYYFDNHGQFNVFIAVDDNVYTPVNANTLGWVNKIYSVLGDVPRRVAVATDAFEDGIISSGLNGKITYFNALADNSIAAMYPLYSQANNYPVVGQFGYDWTSYNPLTGITGNFTGHMDTSVNIPTLTRTSIGFGIWVNAGTTTSGFDMGVGSSYAATGDNDRCYIQLDQTDNIFLGGLGQSAPSSNTGYLGWLTVNYNTATTGALTLYRNGVQAGIDSGHDLTWQKTGSFWFMAGAGFFTRATIDTVVVSSGLTAAEELLLYGLVQQYRKDLGRS